MRYAPIYNPTTWIIVALIADLWIDRGLKFSPSASIGETYIASAAAGGR